MATTSTTTTTTTTTAATTTGKRLIGYYHRTGTSTSTTLSLSSSSSTPPTTTISSICNKVNNSSSSSSNNHHNNEFTNRGGFCGALQKSPPTIPPNILRRLANRENLGLGKVKVILRVTDNYPVINNDVPHYMGVDKKKRQVTLLDPTTTTTISTTNSVALPSVSIPSSVTQNEVETQPSDTNNCITTTTTAVTGTSSPSTISSIGTTATITTQTTSTIIQERGPMVAAPKMFAFDGLFTNDDLQTDICTSALSDIIPAVLEGVDGCVLSFGYPGSGQKQSMLGSISSADDLGIIPSAITWLYKGINERRQRSGTRFSVRVSALSVCATKPGTSSKDLLAQHATESDESPGIYLRDDFLGGPTELRATTLERAALFLDAALAERRQLQQHTNLLEPALLFTLHVYQYSLTKTASGGSTNNSRSNGIGGSVAGGRSRLHLIDLGGCANRNGGLPLSGFGNILLAILSGQRHPPNRDHPLTPLLKDCLAPVSCNVSILAHVSYLQSHTDALTTIQLASRIHRMRRRKFRYPLLSSDKSLAINNHTTTTSSTTTTTIGNPSGHTTGSSSGPDPSSSDLSTDTVIYMGPCIEDATDGEHPPVYLPSLLSGDNRCAMSKALKGSTAERPSIQNNRSSMVPIKKGNNNSPIKSSQQQRTINGVESMDLLYSPIKLQNTVKVLDKSSVGSPIKHTNLLNKSSNMPTPKSSPHRRATQSQQIQYGNGNNNVTGSTHQQYSEEQWVDGPKLSKAKVAEARHLLREVNHRKQCETWIDGPKLATTTNEMSPNKLLSSEAVVGTQSNLTVGYGFMDNHKKIMIRQWVENQTQIFKPTVTTTPTPQTNSNSPNHHHHHHQQQQQQHHHKYHNTNHNQHNYNLRNQSHNSQHHHHHHHHHQHHPNQHNNHDSSVHNNKTQLLTIRNQLYDENELLNNDETMYICDNGLMILNNGRDSISVGPTGIEQQGHSNIINCSTNHNRYLETLDCDDDDDDDDDDVSAGIPILNSVRKSNSSQHNTNNGNNENHSSQEEEDQDSGPSEVPPALALIETISSRDVSHDSLHIIGRHQPNTTANSTPSKECLRTQTFDCALQVTEDDIARAMGCDHPLSALSNGDMSVVSSMNAGDVLNGCLLGDRTRNQFDQLARLREIYTSQLAMAEVKPSYGILNHDVTSVFSEPAYRFINGPGSVCSEPTYRPLLSPPSLNNHDRTNNNNNNNNNKNDNYHCNGCLQSYSFMLQRSHNHMSPSQQSLPSLNGIVQIASMEQYASLRHPDGSSDPSNLHQYAETPGGSILDQFVHIGRSTSVTSLKDELLKIGYKTELSNASNARLTTPIKTTSTSLSSNNIGDGGAAAVVTTTITNSTSITVVATTADTNTIFLQNHQSSMLIDKMAIGQSSSEQVYATNNDTPILSNTQLSQLPPLPLSQTSEAYDSGHDSSTTPRTSKHSCISRRAESGYHSVATVRDSDESSSFGSAPSRRLRLHHTHVHTSSGSSIGGGTTTSTTTAITTMSPKKSSSSSSSSQRHNQHHPHHHHHHHHHPHHPSHPPHQQHHQKSLCNWLRNPFNCTYPDTEGEISDF